MKVLFTVAILSLLSSTTGEECADKITNCAIFKRLCNGKPQLMKDVCPKTCGICPKAYRGPPSDAAITEAVINEAASTEAFITEATTSTCPHPAVSSTCPKDCATEFYIDDNGCKACHCKQVLNLVQVPPVHECQDNWPDTLDGNCGTHKHICNERNTQDYKWMTEYCRKTCGLCDGKCKNEESTCGFYEDIGVCRTGGCHSDERVGENSKSDCPGNDCQCCKPLKKCKIEETTCGSFGDLGVCRTGGCHSDERVGKDSKSDCPGKECQCCKPPKKCRKEESTCGPHGDLGVCRTGGCHKDERVSEYRYYDCPGDDCQCCKPHRKCSDGDSMISDDGCNTCVCIDGIWGCTKMACPTKIAECINGDSMNSDDGCNTCVCVDGVWECTKMACPKKIAVTTEESGCADDDLQTSEPECSDGDSLNAKDGCNRCVCVSGGWRCTILDCSQRNAVTVPPLATLPLVIECVDISGYCGAYSYICKEKGHEYYPWMMENCKKSCGLCNAGY